MRSMVRVFRLHRPHFRLWLAAAVLTSACADSDSTNGGDGDLGSDGDADGDWDRGGDADEDVARDADDDHDHDRDLPVDHGCSLPPESFTIAETPGAFHVSSLIELPDGHFVLVGESEQPAGPRTKIMVLQRDDLTVVGESTLDLERLTATYDVRTGDLIALGEARGQVTFYRLSIGFDWTVEVVGSRELCTGCRAAHAPPTSGPSVSVAAVSAPGRGEAQVYVVPNDSGAPVRPSGPFEGFSPLLVEGSYGPLLFHLVDRRPTGEGDLRGVQLHWNAEVSRELGPIHDGPISPDFTGFAERGGDIYLAVVMPSAMVRLLSFDGAGTFERSWEIDDAPDTDLRPLFSVGERTIAFAWLRDGGDGTAHPQMKVASFEGLDSSIIDGPVSAGPECQRTPGDGPGLVALAAERGHLFIWDSCEVDGAHRLHGAYLLCDPGP